MAAGKEPSVVLMTVTVLIPVRKGPVRPYAVRESAGAPGVVGPGSGGRGVVGVGGGGDEHQKRRYLRHRAEKAVSRKASVSMAGSWASRLARPWARICASSGAACGEGGHYLPVAPAVCRARRGQGRKAGAEAMAALCELGWASTSAKSRTKNVVPSPQRSVSRIVTVSKVPKGSDEFPVRPVGCPRESSGEDLQKLASLARISLPVQQLQAPRRHPLTACRSSYPRC